MTGNVQVRKGTQKITADQIIYDQPSETLEGTGDVKLWDEGLFLSGDHAQIELDTDLITIDNAAFMSIDEHARGEASLAQNQRQRILPLWKTFATRLATPVAATGS